MGIKKKIEKEKLKKKIEFALENKHMQIDAQVYSKWRPRWLEICGGDEIDFDNPYVKVEMVLCKIQVQRILCDQHKTVEQRRKEVRKFFPDEESFNLYCTGIQPLDPDNTPYTYMESKSMMGHARYNIAHKI